jgi:hypothetical protein
MSPQLLTYRRPTHLDQAFAEQFVKKAHAISRAIGSFAPYRKLLSLELIRTFMRFAAQSMVEVRRCVADCPADMRVDVESGIPIDAQTAAELRCLPSWPSGVLIEAHRDPTSVSVVEVKWE